MNTTTTIPVTISPEAEQLAAELGMRSEMDLMIEHIGTSIPGVLELEVFLQPPYDAGGGDQIILYAKCDLARIEQSGWSSWDYRDWKIETFPPEVCQHFTLLYYFGEDDAR